jgi:DNA-binding PadR family transcriptional regulator
MMANDGTIENMVLELRRGVIVLAVLSQLQEEQYGYSVLKLLSDQGLEVDQGTLYPLLRRLEGQGLLESHWRVEEARPRRYYVISPEGKALLPRLVEEWQRIVATMAGITAEPSAPSEGQPRKETGNQTRETL